MNEWLVVTVVITLVVAIIPEGRMVCPNCERQD